jgi:hypothetical protein
MANYDLHKADSRGHANLGWLDSRQTFSFSGYYNPDMIHFGALRVLNDDVVAGGRGFGLHPHDNMEIISLVLEGALEHKDNMGNTGVLRQGEVQVMSTGSGVFHSEYNKNADLPARFLQIWLYPNQLEVAPRYDQIITDAAQRKNKLQRVVSPKGGDGGTWIYQDAWFSLGDFEKGKGQNYPVQKAGDGVYVFVISGSFSVDGQVLNSRDGLAVTDAASVNLQALEDGAVVLIMEVPIVKEPV